MKKASLISLIFLFFFVSCSKDNKDNSQGKKYLTIFFINDQHGQIDNFSKIKHIIDQERLKTNVIVACAGDMFSGNPVVDNHLDKGYPMIDIMNRVGFDISVYGNHEFDYGIEVLADRLQQADFEIICTNIDMGSTGIPEPLEYLTITDGNVDVTFLGLIETNGKQTATIPSTHPLKVEGITFARPENVVSQYSSIKEQENSDLYIALTHLGYDLNFGLGDTQLASQFPYFDMIIGGHTHITENGVVNNIPIFNAGGYLNTLGKVVMRIRDKNIDVYSYEVIDLNSYQEFDSDLQAIIDQYNDLPYLKEVIGYSHQYHNNSQVGCFYTDALRGEMDVDVSFQNTGGIRSALDEGDITVREIFEISPFNNGTIIYQMTVTEIKDFLVGSASGFYYSGIQLEQDGNSIIFKDLDNNILSDDTVLSVGINDYIPAVYDTYFPTNGILQSMTAAETIISYLKTKNNQVDYSDCNRYFRYQLEIE